MADKALCPGCDSYTSSVRRGIEDGTGCPYCGLPAATIAQVDEIRERRGDEKLKEELAAALVALEREVAESARLRSQLATIRRAVKEADD